jgi:hypothetical protein
MQDLRTIATFGHPVEANLARNRLEAEGIPAFLLGEDTVAMAWPFTSGEGGIQLQVPADDAGRATACLAEAEASSLSTPSPEAIQTSPRPPDFTPDEEEPVLTTREQNAARAFRGALVFLVFLPLQFYVFYLLLKVYASDERLAPSYRRKAWIAAAVNLPIVLLHCVTVRLAVYFLG